MKNNLIYLLIVFAISLIFFNCSKDDDLPQDFTPSDIVGRWTGQAICTNGYEGLNLTVDFNGNVNVTVIGDTAFWYINKAGKIDGIGTRRMIFYNLVNGHLLVVSDSTVYTNWSLQLDIKTKKKITGKYDVMYSGYRNMPVILNKQP